MADDSLIVLPIAGRRITQLRYDFAFTMEFSDEINSLSIRIGAALTLTSPAGTAEYNPERAIECGPTLRLFNARVIEAKVFSCGRLEIWFSDGVSLAVEPDSHFEAWQATSTYGLHLVSLPGGGLAIL